jgi:hypothetical protein
VRWHQENATRDPRLVGGKRRWRCFLMKPCCHQSLGRQAEGLVCGGERLTGKLTNNQSVHASHAGTPAANVLTAHASAQA